MGKKEITSTSVIPLSLGVPNAVSTQYFLGISVHYLCDTRYLTVILFHVDTTYREDDR